MKFSPLPAYSRAPPTARLKRALVLRRLTLLVVVVACFAASCKPSAGSACSRGEARCLDAARELACQAGQFIETPCLGPGGCSTSEKGTNCDFSGDRPGAACSTDDDGAATCVSKEGMLACHDGRYVLLHCRGSRGCVNAEGRASCDTSIAEPGDVCHDEKMKACSVDGTEVLACKQQSMQRLYSCRGKNGCLSAGGKLSCDTSIAKLGDACDKKLEGQAFSCSPDGSAIVVCKAGAFSLDQTCKTGQRCSSVGSSTLCSKSGK